MIQKTKIVVVGGGFTGLTVLKKLEKKLKEKAELILIDKGPQFWFKARLIDFFNDESEEFAAVPYRVILEGRPVNFIQAKIERVDLETQEVTLHTGSRIAYDYLVLSQGAEVGLSNLSRHRYAFHFFGNKESVWDIKKKIEELFIRTDGQPPSLAVVGGGASGVELVFAIKHFIETEILPDYPSFKDSYSINLVEAGPEILFRFSRHMRELVLLFLKKQKISLITNFRVADVQEKNLLSADGRAFLAGMIIWTAGIEQNRIKLNKKLNFGTNSCWQVDEFLRIAPQVFSGGDAACFLKDGQSAAKDAQTAIIMGKNIALNIENSIKGKKLAPFKTFSGGSILLLGREAAIDLGWLFWCGTIPRYLRDFYYRFQWKRLTN